jgi:starch synthase
VGYRVLLCTSEAVPFVKTGGLADVAGALPLALARLGHDVRLALPGYAEIDPKITSRPVGRGFDLLIGEKPVVVTMEQSDALPGVPTYLVKCPEYFGRTGLYGRPDDPERFGLFCLAMLEFIKDSKWRPDVIHCNDWQTALIPVFLKRRYGEDPALSKIGTLLTIHNLAYQGVFEPPALEAIGLDQSLFTVDGLEFYGNVNFLKGGLLFADVLNTVSKTYAQEIQTPEYGERLEGVLVKRRADLYGILNGVDYVEWDPATDGFIEANYDATNLAPKDANKAALQRRYNLPERADLPVFGLVSRFAGQKGLDILAEVLPHLLQLEAQFVFLGTGEPHYEELLSSLARRFPDKMGVSLAFDNPLAHLIYAGSDMFLMPSRYEPCGLGQIISLRYGTIPVVRSTGGLADTITDFKPESREGNGFAFEDYSAAALMGAMARGMMTFGAKPLWSRLIQNAMACDFSWDRSAQEYETLYQRAAHRRRRS